MAYIWLTLYHRFKILDKLPLGNFIKEMECGLNQERTCTTNQQGNIDY